MQDKQPFVLLVKLQTKSQSLMFTESERVPKSIISFKN